MQGLKVERPRPRGAAGPGEADRAEAGPIAGPADPVAAAVAVLTEAAGVPLWPLTPEEQRRVLRAARAASHPDRHGGDQSRWDTVEAAARALGVS